jgi:hypothetical protein
MKNLFKLSLLLLVFSCSKNDVQTNEELNQTKTTSDAILEKKLSSTDTTFVVDETRKSMASFVMSIRGYYTNGDTYNQLKKSLDPVNELSSMTSVGNDLLFLAYNYIVDDIDDKDMSGEKMMIALNEILARADNLGIEYANDVDLEEGSTWLFGLDPSISSNKGCRWYQLGCHAATVWNWLTSTGSGGGSSNGSTLAAVVGMVLAIIAFFND